MQPETFRIMLQAIYGSERDVAEFCREFGCTKPTVYRYFKGDTPIPRNVALSILMRYRLGEEAPLSKPHGSPIPLWKNRTRRLLETGLVGVGISAGPVHAASDATATRRSRRQDRTVFLVQWSGLA